MTFKTILTSYGKGDRPVSEEVRSKRQIDAQLEWRQVLASNNLHDAAMWLQREGFRLRDLSTAIRQWNRLADNQ